MRNKTIKKEKNVLFASRNETFTGQLSRSCQISFRF